jgi:Trk-type K+ transport system membrane component
MPRTTESPAPPRQPTLSWPQQRALAATLIVGWIALIGYGAIALRQPGVMVDGEQLAPSRAVFLSMNAATLTGFQQAVGINEFDPDSSRGPAIILTLIFTGAMCSMIVGGLAMVRILRLNYSVWQVVVSATLFLFLAAMGGSAVIIGHGTTLFDAIFQSAAAFANCGIATGPVGTVLDPSTYLLAALAVLGGLGLPMLMELYDALWGLRKLSPHTRTVVKFSAGIYLAGFALLFLFQCPMERGVGWAIWRQAIASSSIEAINARTAGLHVEMIGALPRAAQWILILLMAIGASPGGTGGGVKSTTLVQLWRGMRNALAGRPVTREFGIAAVRVAIYVVIVLTALLTLLMINDEIAADQILFIVVSAASNVGLSHNPIAVVGVSLHVLSAVMFVGRLSPLAILWWMAETTDAAELAVG